MSRSPTILNQPAASLAAETKVAPVSRSAIRTEQIVLAALVVCTLEGAARKWLIPTASPVRYLAYFSKDMILAACLTLPALRSFNPYVGRYRQLLGVGIALTLVGCAIGTATNFNLVGAILTLRATVVLPILAVLIGMRLSQGSLLRAASFMVPLVLVNALLGSVQFYSPADSAINQYAAEGKWVSTAAYAEYIRATGTFSYITGFANFSAVAVALGIILLRYAETQRERVIAYATILAGIVCAGATVSRGAMLGCVAIFVGWTALSRRASRTVVGFALFMLAYYLAAEFTGTLKSTTEILGSVQRRSAVVSDNVIDRILVPFLAVPVAISYAPFGQGVGTEQVAGNYYVAGQTGFTTFEAEWPRIVMEIGVIGFVGVLFTYLGILGVLYQAWRTTSDRRLKDVLLAILLIGGFLFYSGVVFNHVASFYYWTLMGLALAAAQDKSA